MIIPPRKPPSVSDNPIEPVAQLATSTTKRAAGGEDFFILSARDQIKQRPHDQPGQRVGDAESGGGLRDGEAELQHQGKTAAALVERVDDNEKKDRGDVLKNQNCCRGQANRTILLMPLRNQSRNDGGRGKRQRCADEKSRQRGRGR